MKNFIFRILQNSGLIIISLGLLYGGVLILRTQIPFWSFLYGIPAVFLGILMSLISFNEIAKNRIAKATEYHKINCRVCGKLAMVPMLTESTVCSDCQYRMALRLQMVALLFFVMLAIPITFHLAQTDQEIRQHAQIPFPTPQCERGIWKPLVCQCGAWDQELRCGSERIGRRCSSELYCCEKNEGKVDCVKYGN